MPPPPTTTTDRNTRNYRHRNIYKHFIHIFITFILVCFAWIFFRANNLTDAFVICSKITALPNELIGYIQGLSQAGVMGTVKQMFLPGTDFANPIQHFGLTAFGLSFIFIAILIIAEISTRKEVETVLIMKFPLVVRWVAYTIIIGVLMLSFIMQTQSPEFIYFAF